MRHAALRTVCLFLLPLQLLRAAPPVAELYSAQGTVESRRPPASDWVPARVGFQFQGGDAAHTGPNGRAGLRMQDGVMVRLNENSLMEFKAGQPVRVESGAAYFFLRQPTQNRKIETPLVSAAVRGTELAVEVTPQQTIISVLDGEVECSNPFGAVQLQTGEQAVTVPGAAPVKRILVRPLDAVQWALYYPPVLDAGDAALPVELRQAAAFLAAGQVTKAEAALAKVDKPLPGAMALRAIVALITNRKAEALELAKQATAAGPDSAAAALAMSYVAQGHFKLDEARHWALKAVELQPKSGLTRARLAELELGFGNLKRAFQIASDSLAVASNDVRVLTVLGFTYLTRYQTHEAVKMFQRAIAGDDASGLAHAGLGLALMRQGKVEAGRRELELAAHLEPTDANFRSYLGKAYFEEKRDRLATHEYGLARQLDPLDPTPLLYDAFYKLGNYRPVEALWDLEDSIRLNDNRAVYRSRLMLDQDLAVRSAGLAGAFSIVGFPEAARVEAIKSLNRDYSNFSAHLLLSDSASGTGESQVGISESTIVRLLVPLNINATSSGASFNEYTSLFDRQRLRLEMMTSGQTGEDAFNWLVRQSGAFERFAYVWTYGEDWKRGFRVNDSDAFPGGTFFGQFQLTPADTLTYESQYSEDRYGDTTLHFNPHTNDPDYHIKFTDFLQRVGFHHRFGPGAHVIGQVLYFDRNLNTVDDLDRYFTLRGFYNGSLIATLQDNATVHQMMSARTSGVRGDGQFIADFPVVSLVAGVAVLDTSVHGGDRSTGTNDNLALLTNFVLSSSGKFSERSESPYLYTTWHWGQVADITLGGNYTRLESPRLSIPPPYSNETIVRDKINPKAGITVYATPSTMLRAAYFQTLSGADVGDLDSIEPTQVAGFNQLTGFRGARAETFAVAVDHKIAKWTYVGAEVQHRNYSLVNASGEHVLDININTGDQTMGPMSPPTLLYNTGREETLSAYLYQVLHKTLTATADYTLSRDDETTRITTYQVNQNTLTHRVRLGLNYFHPTGWWATAGGTWRGQELSGFGAPMDGVRDFWIVNLRVGYYFPKRTGGISFGVENLLDQDYRYQRPSYDSRFLPMRTYSARVAVNF